jgi:sulfate adenylyltransferase
VKQRGFTVFLTGLSGAGKSTTAVALIRRLEQLGRTVTFLDGDAVRKHLSRELGFSREHRDLNIRRIGFVASEITRHGGVCICANIAPYQAVRSEVRGMVEAHGGFVLVHVATPISVCEARDPKGLYARARAGLLQAFTGVSDPYETPTDADITMDTSTTSPSDAAEVIVQLLQKINYLPK